MYVMTLPSPVGELTLLSDGERLVGCHLPEHGGAARVDPLWTRDDGPLREAGAQLEAYFAGERDAFTLPLAPRGTPFQREVWQALTAIPYGTTVSYGTIAARVGRPRAMRAVGAANRRNPIAIIVPCHRVIGADGSLTGYGGGLERKQVLLELERRRPTR